MHKIISIFLLTFFSLGALIPKSDMEELFKIPNLIQHYQTNHTDLSFGDFLAAHYNEADHSDQDHEQLPLKHHHHQGLQLFDVLVPAIHSDFLAISLTTPASLTPKIVPEYHFLYSPIFSPPPQV